MTDRKSLSLVEALERFLSVVDPEDSTLVHTTKIEWREFLSDIRTALADTKAQKPVAWLDIESVPKDRPVIVAVEREHPPKWVVGEAHYYEDGEAWYWAGNDPSDSWGGPIYPKYWTPLPAAPDATPQPAPSAFDPEAVAAAIKECLSQFHTSWRWVGVRIAKAIAEDCLPADEREGWLKLCGVIANEVADATAASPTYSTR